MTGLAHRPNTSNGCRKRLRHLALMAAAMVLVCIVGIAAPSAAAEAPQKTEDIPIGAGRLIALPRPAAEVLLANPAVADVQTPSPSRVFIFGRTSGTTTLYALDKDENVIWEREIRVTVNTGTISAALRARFPHYNLALESAPGSVVVKGQVENAADADEVMKTVEQFLSDKDKAINRLTLNTPTQVNLRVRIVEISRKLDQQLGINWMTLINSGRFNFRLYNGRQFIDPATGLFELASGGAYSVGGGYSMNDRSSLNALVDALDQEGLATTLAEPNLTAISGQTASFLAGGEFPIPVSTSLTGVTVNFKSFGVALNFTPTVLSRDRISLHVRPEVSELSSTNSVVVDGITIPGLNVRRMETTVELGSGQSFAIAGLLQSDMQDQVSKLPGIGNVPILGKLFTSATYLKSESELVVVVTPYVVRPAGANALLTPLDTLRPASDVEYVVNRKKGISPDEAMTGPRLQGPAGFVY